MLYAHSKFQFSQHYSMYFSVPHVLTKLKVTRKDRQEHKCCMRKHHKEEGGRGGQLLCQTTHKLQYLLLHKCCTWLHEKNEAWGNYGLLICRDFPSHLPQYY